MATPERAVELAARAHAGQKDKAGGPYIFHALRLMLRVSGEAAQMAAVLHDVVEDTAVTLADLRAEGFPAEVVAAVECLTYRPDEPYADYIIRCSADPIARAVKVADLEDNAALPRALLRPDREAADLARFRRYVLSYQFLIGRLTEAEYRARMAGG